MIEDSMVRDVPLVRKRIVAGRRRSRGPRFAYPAAARYKRLAPRAGPPTMPTPREVRALVQRFHENRASYLSGPYNETQRRPEPDDPLTYRTFRAKTMLQRQITATDRQIDELVYELYGLTDDEIRIVDERMSEPRGRGS